MEALEGRVLTCFQPKTWVETIAEDCEVTMSAMSDFQEGAQGTLALVPLPRDSMGGTKKLHTGCSGVWLFRGALQGEAGFACTCYLV